MRLRFSIFNRRAGSSIMRARRRIAGQGWQQWMRLMPLPAG